MATYLESLNSLAKCIMFFLFSLVALGGLIIATVQPPFYAPDEPWHWQTAWYRFEQLRSNPADVCNKALGLPELFEVKRVAFHYAEPLPSKTIQRADEAKVVCMPSQVSPIGYANTERVNDLRQRQVKF